MTQEQKKRVFMMFGNLKFKQDINQGGLGLGLYTSKILCKMFGGFIRFDQVEENVGCTVTFVIQAQISTIIG